MLRLILGLTILSNIGCATMTNTLGWGDPTKNEFVTEAPKVAGQPAKRSYSSKRN